MLSKDAIVICHMPLSLLQNPITYHQYHALLTIMSVRVTDRVQWAAEQFLPSGINVIKRGNVQGLLRFSVVQREREREHPQEWGRRQEQNHQAQLSEQTLGFQRLKSQSTYKTEFLSIPSSPSPFLVNQFVFHRGRKRRRQCKYLGRHSKSTRAEWINSLLIKWLSYFKAVIPPKRAGLCLGPLGMSFTGPGEAQSGAEVWKGMVWGRCSPRKALV